MDHPIASIGAEKSGTCVFDNCPVYCASHGDTCTQLTTDLAGDSYFNYVQGKSNCVDSHHNTDNLSCIAPTKENCPPKNVYYYEKDTIKERPAVVSVNADMKCVYEPPADDSSVVYFMTREDALRNCRGMPSERTCYTAHPKSFEHGTYSLDRTTCTYNDEPPNCILESDLRCEGSVKNFELVGETYDDTRGIKTDVYSQNDVPDTLTPMGKNYTCVSVQTTPPNCADVCYTSDGKYAPKLRKGTMVDNTCYISDCFSKPQRRFVGDCEAEPYYFYASDNETVLQGFKNTSVSDTNECVYDTPNDGRVVFASLNDAKTNCRGAEGSIKCFDRNTSTLNTHLLNRNTCQYDGAPASCESVAVGDICEGETTFQRYSQDITTDADGTLRRNVIQTTLPNTYSSTDGVRFQCGAPPTPTGYENEVCGVSCYGTFKPGVVENNECVVTGCSN